MKVLICVDDTDDLTKSTSTGKIADRIAQRVADLGGTLEKGITRHQLLLHEDIAYTSHNSSMCMVMDMEISDMNAIWQVAEEVLREHMAASSDPGICVCRLDQLRNPDRLIAYGKRAQQEVIAKEEAYALAEAIGGIGLKEYGGTGIGVIGALAGVGLRLSGCDGTFRGGKGDKYAGKAFPVSEWKTIQNIEQVVDFQGEELADDVIVAVDKRFKLAMLDHKKTLIATLRDGTYIACRKKDLYQAGKQVNNWTTSCEDFEADNDTEECYTDSENACYNCLYRRWTADGFICVKKK